MAVLASVVLSRFLHQLPERAELHLVSMLFSLSVPPPQTRESPRIQGLLPSGKGSTGVGQQTELCLLQVDVARTFPRPQPQEALTHLGLLLMQLYLNVCELGPEVFIGSLEGDNECLGLLALISPFLGHCSFLSGVCWFVILSSRRCHVTDS